MTDKHHSTTVASQSAKINKIIHMDQNNTLGIIQHINDETSLHKEHHISTSHIFELHKQKRGKLEEHRKKYCTNRSGAN
jgi:hypothetical protein